jgi:hypothetical protein
LEEPCFEPDLESDDFEEEDDKPDPDFESDGFDFV